MWMIYKGGQALADELRETDVAPHGVAMWADLLVPTHYDLFPNNRDNPAFVVDYLFRTYRAQKFHMMAPGERLLYVKSPVEA